MKSKKAMTWTTLITAVLIALVIFIVFTSMTGHNQIINTLIGDLFGR